MNIIGFSSNASTLRFKRESFRVFEDIDDGVPPEEELGQISNFLHGSPLLAFLWHLEPDFLDILHDHIHVSIKCLYFPQQLLVVPQSNKDVVVSLDTLGEERERADIE
jgi:hypothetical protein